MILIGLLNVIKTSGLKAALGERALRSGEQFGRGSTFVAVAEGQAGDLGGDLIKSPLSVIVKGAGSTGTVDQRAGGSHSPRIGRTGVAGPDPTAVAANTAPRQRNGEQRHAKTESC
jgi:hypothetical protein